MSSAGSYQNYFSFVASDRNRVSARQPSYLSCSHKKRNPKNAPLLPASRHSVCGAAQLALRFQRAAQTNGGKLENDATLSCGSVSRSLNHMPQAQPKGMGTDGMCDLCRNWHLVQYLITLAAINFTKKLSGCPHLVSPLLPTPATASSWG